MPQSADAVLGAQAAASMHSTQQKQSLQHEELQAKTFHNSSDKVNIKAQVLAQPLALPWLCSTHDIDIHEVHPGHLMFWR